MSANSSSKTVSTNRRSKFLNQAIIEVCSLPFAAEDGKQ